MRSSVVAESTTLTTSASLPSEGLNATSMLLPVAATSND
jgi:hypothetical protein